MTRPAPDVRPLLLAVLLNSYAVPRWDAVLGEQIIAQRTRMSARQEALAPYLQSLPSGPWVGRAQPVLPQSLTNAETYAAGGFTLSQLTAWAGASAILEICSRPPAAPDLATMRALPGPDWELALQVTGEESRKLALRAEDALTKLHPTIERFRSRAGNPMSVDRMILATADLIPDWDRQAEVDAWLPMPVEGYLERARRLSRRCWSAPTPTGSRYEQASGNWDIVLRAAPWVSGQPWAERRDPSSPLASAEAALQRLETLLPDQKDTLHRLGRALTGSGCANVEASAKLIDTLPEIGRATATPRRQVRRAELGVTIARLDPPALAIRDFVARRVFGAGLS